MVKRLYQGAIICCSFFIVSPLVAQQRLKIDDIKFVISIGDQVRMAYDNVSRSSSREISQSNADGSISYQLNMGDFHMYKGNYSTAISYYHKVLDRLAPEVKTDKDPRTIDVFSISENRDFRFTRTERILKKISRSSELSKEQWVYFARAVNALAIYYHGIGNYKVAEKLYLRALEVRKEYIGNTSEHYVSCLHNLAILRKDQGRYNAAEDMLKYVSRYYLHKKSKNSTEYSIVANNHAMLLNEMGRSKQSVQLLESQESILDQIEFPGGSFDPSRVRANYALLLLEEGRTYEAEVFLKASLKKYEQTGKEKDPDYVQISLYLGEVYLSLGKTSELEELVQHALNGLEKNYGANSLPYANALELQADYLRQSSNYHQAYSQYEKVAAIRKANLGVLHKGYLSVIQKQGACAWRLGQNVPAFNKYKEATDGYLQVIDKFFFNMSEKEKTRFWNTIKPSLEEMYVFVASDGFELEGAIAYAYEVRLRTKGLLLHNSNKVLEEINNIQDTEVKKQYNDWLSLKHDLSNYYSMSQATIEEMQIDVSLLETEANEIEKAINLAVSGKINEQSEKITFEMVAASLGEEEAAIEIIRLSDQGKNENAQYGAWIVRDGHLEFEIIGAANLLETRMIKYYKNAVRLKWKDSLSYDKFWKPLAAETAGTTRVYVSLDGVYNLLNLNSLMTNGQYLLDRRQIEIIPNSAVLVSNKNSGSSINKGVLMGNPVFGSAEIAPLPGTAAEIKTIDELLNENNINTRFYEQARATEKSLKQVSNPSILHIATHGFFMGDKVSNEGNIASRTLRSANPLMRSGLLLAGAGQQDEPSVENPSDGVFTAYDAMNMNLSDTELVVLSACETGTGEVVNGEGVYGLSRAFSVAGAKHLVMSLWKVDDQATMKLMSTFYKNWLAGEEIKTAFNQAQKAVKEEYEDPYYWAAFVMVNNE
ncbi:MAG: CHAT domain-containing tetratricopeptide repeat protein [Reichenbachiella sp.]|uniref:CHAT domain-containing tetratricopeptide repeat protein n=1 Tax=Reichenbachiella sp. TaxID=2184521 RepID=UPI002966E410|nr:CHAT domain-containing tetratricopeptide repeat protein [Reichenbachiella sp.]MDW3210902.1 CHAT domain-containing tetratricopeptide repeat protein [Reichenbachiella sp.]